MRGYSSYTNVFNTIKGLVSKNSFEKDGVSCLFSTHGDVLRGDLPGLEVFPEDLVEVLKLRLKKTFHGEHITGTGNDSEMIRVLLNIQKLMKNAEFAVEKGRTGVLDNRS